MAEDGRGPSVWDTFCAEPGRIAEQPEELAPGGPVGVDPLQRGARQAPGLLLGRWG